MGLTSKSLTLGSHLQSYAIIPLSCGHIKRQETVTAEERKNEDFTVNGPISSLNFATLGPFT